MSRILIVDDASDITALIQSMLETHGHEVVGVAHDGLDAFEKYKALNPDVVLMDIMMPGMNGMQSIRMIMEHDKKARIVVVTALGRSALMKEAVEAGAVGYVTKPFEIRRLLEAVEVAINPPWKKP